MRLKPSSVLASIFCFWGLYALCIYLIVYAPKLKRIERDTGLSLPANSVVVHFVATRNFIDPAWDAKIIIPNASSDEIKRVITEKRPLEKDALVSGPSPSDSHTWWTPENVVFEQYYWEGNQNLVHIIFAEEGNENVTLYIEFVMF